MAKTQEPQKAPDLAPNSQEQKSLSSISEEQTEAQKSLSNLSQEHLEREIKKLKDEQQESFRKSSELDPIIANKLSILIEEQRRRTGQELTEYVDEVTTTQPQEVPEQYVTNWFAQATESELEAKRDIKIVVGSPVTEILSARYIKQYEIPEEITHYSPEDLKAMSPDEAYAARKEIKRQQDFIISYKNSDVIDDQDIFVSSIAARFSDKTNYPPVSAIRNDDNPLLFHYFFTDGKIDAQYDRKKRTYNLSVSGLIPGRISIAIKRRTNSGRIMGNDYDILELQDGRPVFYTCSSKGNLSVADVENIKKIAASDYQTTLEKPKQASIKELTDITEEEVQEVLTPKPPSPVAIPTQQQTPTTPPDILKHRVRELKEALKTASKPTKKSKPKKETHRSNKKTSNKAR